MKLFILINSGGEGSYGIFYCLEKSILDKLKDLVFDGKILEEDCPGFDGDAFSYKTIEIPDGCTIESMGIDIDDLITEETVNDLESIYDDMRKKQKEKKETISRITVLNRKLIYDKATKADKIELRKLREKAISKSWI